MPLAEDLDRTIPDARRALRGAVRRTPLLYSPGLTARVGGPVFLKLENLQHGGSFKYRPALYNMLRLRDRGDVAGVVTSSSGNFAIATALAADACRMPATIVVRPSAATFKVERARALGAEIVVCEDRHAARAEQVERLVRERGLVAIHPHDSVPTVAGDASLGFEIAEEAPEDAQLLVPTSGGGLLAGVTLGMRGKAGRIVGVQPAANGSMAMSLAAGERRERDPVVTVADGLTAGKPGEIGFAIARVAVDDVVCVSEEALVAAVACMHRAEGLIVEAAGAAGLAALIEERVTPHPAGNVVVVTGANVAPATWREWVA